MPILFCIHLGLDLSSNKTVESESSTLSLFCCGGTPGTARKRTHSSSTQGRIIGRSNAKSEERYLNTDPDQDAGKLNFT